MKRLPYVTASMKNEREQGGRCGSRAAGPGGIAGRCIDFDQRVPVEPLVLAVGSAVSEMLSQKHWKMRAFFIRDSTGYVWCHGWKGKAVLKHGYVQKCGMLVTWY